MTKEQQEKLEKLNRQVKFLADRSRNVTFMDSDEAGAYDQDLRVAQGKRHNILRDVQKSEE